AARGSSAARAGTGVPRFAVVAMAPAAPGSECYAGERVRVRLADEARPRPETLDTLHSYVFECERAYDPRFHGGASRGLTYTVRAALAEHVLPFSRGLL